ERRDAAAARHAAARGGQADRLRLREVRLLGRTQAAARSLGKRDRERAALTLEIRMKLTALFILAALAVLPAPAKAQGTLTVYCSVLMDWCQLMTTEFERATG